MTSGSSGAILLVEDNPDDEAPSRVPADPRTAMLPIVVLAESYTRGAPTREAPE